MAILNRSNIFRDTKYFYLNETKDLASPALIKFVLKRSGKKILDVGCATGNYCLQLTQKGFKCVGVDTNLKYIEKAISKGIIACVMNALSLGFKDKSFDTVLLFEILEHVENPEKILKEVARIAKKNILITVPNNTQLKKLSLFGLTFEHLLDEDHIIFFTKQSLEELLKKHFYQYKITEKEPLIIVPFWLKKITLILHKLKIIKALGYFRLYAEVIL